jgi:hypothetical protein
MEFLNRLKASRTLPVILVGLLLIVFRTVWPEFPLDDALIEKVLMVLGAYIVAEGLEGLRPADNVFKTLWASRKFKTALASLLLVFVQAAVPDFPITEEQVLKIMNLLATVILGLGVEGSAISGYFLDSEELNQEAIG